MGSKYFKKGKKSKNTLSVDRRETTTTLQMAPFIQVKTHGPGLHASQYAYFGSVSEYNIFVIA